MMLIMTNDNSESITKLKAHYYQQTNVRSIPVWLRVLLPGDAVVVWDTYFQKRINTAHYLSGGIKHDENALKIRSKITLHRILSRKQQIRDHGTPNYEFIISLM